MSDIVKTVRVKPWGKDQGDFVEINADDFDPKVHKLVEPPAPEPDESGLADPLDIPSASEEAVAESVQSEPAPVAASVRPKRKRKG